MTDKDELIERVARAIMNCPHPSPYERDMEFLEAYKEVAQAALAALPLDDYVLKHEAWDQLPASRRRGAEEMRERAAQLAEKAMHERYGCTLLADEIRALSLEKADD